MIATEPRPNFSCIRLAIGLFRPIFDSAFPLPTINMHLSISVIVPNLLTTATTTTLIKITRIWHVPAKHANRMDARAHSSTLAECAPEKNCKPTPRSQGFVGQSSSKLAQVYSSEPVFLELRYFAAFGHESWKGTGGVKKYAKFRHFLAHRVV